MGFPQRVATVKMVNFKATARDWGSLQLLQGSISKGCSISDAIREAIFEACRKRNLVYKPAALVKAPVGSVFAPLLPDVDEDLAAAAPPPAAEVKPDTTVVARGPCSKCGRDRLLNGLGICDVCEVSRHSGGNVAAAAEVKPLTSKPAGKSKGKTKPPAKKAPAGKGKTKTTRPTAKKKG